MRRRKNLLVLYTQFTCMEIGACVCLVLELKQHIFLEDFKSTIVGADKRGRALIPPLVPEATSNRPWLDEIDM